MLVSFLGISLVGIIASDVKTTDKKPVSGAALRMRLWRQHNRQHSRLQARQAYWRRKGLNHYEGVALGRMDEITKDIRNEIEQLRENIHQWNFHYYVWSAPSITDAEFDRAMDRLKELEAKYPQLEDPASPTRRVGAPVLNSNEEVRHSVPMLSLAKAQSAQEVVKFFGNGPEGVLEPKIDGLSLALRYINGRLVQAITRGDGQKGRDVTHNARTIRTIPLLLRKKLTLEVRGEAFMKWSDFARVNARLIAENDEPLVNPRNAAGGGMSLKSPADAAKLSLSFIAYQLIWRESDFERHTEVLEFMEELGFVTPSNLPESLGSCATMFQHGFRLDSQAEVQGWLSSLDVSRKLQDFPTDGLVFKVDDLKLQQELGSGTTSPKWAVAFKYPPDQVKTVITGIEWTVGKTGKVTPVAEFEPVMVSGTTVARASLCNENEIKRLGVNLGDEVLVEKSNEIIPKVISVIAQHSSHPAHAPSQCPACGSAIQHIDGYVDVFCTNTACPAQAEAKLVYAVGKNALDIDGCGPQAIATFVAAGVVTLPDLLKSDCSCLKGATKRKVAEGLKKAMQAPFWRKLSALCVDGWGKTTCQEVATRWPTLTSLLDSQDDGQLAYIIGKEKAAEFGLWSKVHGDEYIALYDLGFFPEKADTTDGSLGGKSFCITGEVGVARHVVEEEIRKRGGITSSSVTKKVNFLVVGNDPGANKQAAARRWGTPILTPDQLFEMMGWRPKVDASAGLVEDY